MLTFVEKLLEMLGTNAKNIEYTQKISLQNSCLTRYFVSYLSIGVPLHPPCPKQRAEGEDFVGISEGKEKKKNRFHWMALVSTTSNDTSVIKYGQPVNFINGTGTQFQNMKWIRCVIYH